MFVLYLLFAGRIYDPFTSCFMLMAEIFSSLVSVTRMKQIDATPEQTGTNVCNNKGYDIEFKNVVFSYNKEPVLKGVSFVAKQGEVTALVGPSGSGKSTASKLAARFWDADSGSITLGGVDVKTVEPETLFKNYAIVFQDVMLFDESVMENIRLGRGDATDEEVMAGPPSVRSLSSGCPRATRPISEKTAAPCLEVSASGFRLLAPCSKMRLLSCWMRQQLPWMPRAKRWCRTHYRYC